MHLGTQGTRALEHLGTRRVLGHTGTQGILALGHLKGTWAIGYSRHLGTGALRHAGAWSLEALYLADSTDKE